MPTTRTSAAKSGAPKSRPRYGGPSQHPLSGPHFDPKTGKRHPGQKGIICQIARRAFAKIAGRPFDRQRDEQACTAWRREQVMVAVGVGSLTLCTQNDYNDLVGHFEGLAGEGGRQFKSAYRQQDEAKRQARYLLDVALEERATHVSYAQKLCRDRFKRGLDDDETTPENLFEVRFTLEQRKPLVNTTAEATCDQPF